MKKLYLIISLLTLIGVIIICAIPIRSPVERTFDRAIDSANSHDYLKFCQYVDVKGLIGSYLIISDEAMAMATDYKRIFEEGTVEEKRFFLRAFLTSIKLDPETGEGEARFVLLPGMQKLDHKLPSSRLFEAHPHEKDLPDADRSSRLFLALRGIEPRSGG
jgi:hypothetical protein